jgi:hypothetical protein
LDWGGVAGGAVHPEVASEPPLILERASIGIERTRATGGRHVSTAFPVPAMAEGAASGSATGANLGCGGVVSGEVHLDESAKYQSEQSESDSELLLKETEADGVGGVAEEEEEGDGDQDEPEGESEGSAGRRMQIGAAAAVRACAESRIAQRAGFVGCPEYTWTLTRARPRTYELIGTTLPSLHSSFSGASPKRTLT